MAIFSPLLYVPYYIAAIYALINRREWIRVPSEFLVSRHSANLM